MMKFDRLWETLENRGITKYQLAKDHGMSKAQLHRLQHNQSVSTNTLDRICNILARRVEEILEHIPDDNRFKP